MMRPRRAAAPAACTGLALALLAGCGGGPTPPPSSPTPVPSSATTTGSAPPGSAGLASIRLDLELVADIPGGPLAVVNAADGSGRLFVVGQDGRVWIVRAGAVAPNPFLDIRSEITTGGERGLLGLAFHPRFATDRRLFVDYTDVNGNTVVSSFRVADPSAATVDPKTEQVILRIDQPFANHNGGAVVFGPDGRLYVTTGDGGGAGDPHDNGQRLDTLLGKILRIDVDGAAPYTVPPDNPFVGRDNARPEIWLTGLRNPWRVSFDQPTGDLWIGDVGQNAWEEIDVHRRAEAAGTNYGWARMEGTHCYPSGDGCARPGFTLPVAEYGHELGCAVTGGDVYRGSAQPRLDGAYVFGDYCSGNVWVLDAASPGSPILAARTGRAISSFGLDETGELYATDLKGSLLHVVVAGS